MADTVKDLFPNALAIDERSAEFLLSKLTSRQKQGFDYLRFKRSLKAMEHLPLDESTRFQSAFAAAQALDVTREELMKTAQYYLDYLGKEQAQFSREAEDRLQKRVKERKQQIEHVTEMIEKYREKVKQLQAQIAGYEEKVSHATAEMESEQERIDSSRQLFDQTCQSLMEAIEEDLEKLNRYLGN